MLACTQCGELYQPSQRGPKVKYLGLCTKCRKKKHTAVHKENHREAFLQKYRFYHKKRAYGMSAEEYIELYATQLGKCAICGTEFPALNERAKLIAVDHDHATGAVRALLCIQCNSAVGMVKEDIAIAERLVDYLKQHKSTNI